MSPSKPIPAAGLDLYRKEVLRWNRQINLISRRKSEQHLDLLIRQCLQGAQALQEALDAWEPAMARALAASWPSSGGERASAPAGSSASYCLTIDYQDIGSGAGLPGLIWHLWLQGAGEPAADRIRPRLRTALVEPRAKRAWFLERMIGMLSLRHAIVLRRTWPDIGPLTAGNIGQGLTGDLAPGGQGAQQSSPEGLRLWLFSLKALALTDDQIWEGWELQQGRRALLPGESLLVCRFRPPGAGLEPAEASRLKLPACRRGPGMKAGPERAAWGLFPGAAPESSAVDLLVSFYGSYPDRSQSEPNTC